MKIVLSHRVGLKHVVDRGLQGVNSGGIPRTWIYWLGHAFQSVASGPVPHDVRIAFNKTKGVISLVSCAPHPRIAAFRPDTLPDGE
jgi:hypothetical protein